MPISVAIADDHYLVAESLAALVRKFNTYEVVFVVENGRDLLNRSQQLTLPDIALVDLDMPEMDGFETTRQLRQLHPTVRVLALSITDREEPIIRMVRHGARGYLRKDCRPLELRRALDDVMAQGFYYSGFLTHQLVLTINAPEAVQPMSFFNLNSREYKFLKMACSELTYNQIADKMCVSPRTVDGYREVVFQKMSVRTRVGMVMEAVRHGLVQL